MEDIVFYFFIYCGMLGLNLGIQQSSKHVYLQSHLTSSEDLSNDKEGQN